MPKQGRTSVTRPVTVHRSVRGPLSTRSTGESPTHSRSKPNDGVSGIASNAGSQTSERTDVTHLSCQLDQPERVQRTVGLSLTMESPA
jgi:hypothetical protein